MLITGYMIQYAKNGETFLALKVKLNVRNS